MKIGNLQKIAIVWFRRDLRLDDNTALVKALQSPWPVLPLFIFDTEILDILEDRADARVDFIHGSIQSLSTALKSYGSNLIVEHGRPLEVFKKIFATFNVQAVFLNHDYESAAIARDSVIEKYVVSKSCEFNSFKDQVVFERTEIAKEDGRPYTVFTPFSRKWKSAYKENPRLPIPSDIVNWGNFFKSKSSCQVPSLNDIGFRSSGRCVSLIPAPSVLNKLLLSYAELRDFPAAGATSRLSVHLRFGTVSPRVLVAAAQKKSETWLNELIWREFFMQILVNFPHVESGPFRREYSRVPWRRDAQTQKDFEKWCQGKTGFPIVDAGMRELNETGYMHNRVRMIAASFLVKQLLIDWRWGERYFASKLLDFDLALNNGNWQWVAGCGCDAAPYFRVFNPLLQAKKFDPNNEYIKLWVPEVDSTRYVPAMVDLKSARLRVLKAYEGV
jgi:deoxyribodipyrimidine photo-lyase